ncbi:NAD(P) transhydrogenase subunit beta [Sulfobacillus thermosulfidooxidans DSM 9293]|uniref:NAD(P) transhydrogenase subunit beta n=2 Tax=Sulfobacillus thermosulfidooxidans TaxID=28034 RepID=A0A1W1WJE5_SULTA|nr:NAD(P)(+) transhydrogenase (Re/Si-specific) subunit beta [Sulfobacillus thermosulfidooxidans]PSR27522.1 MAG: NAD(P)(+) transhydrogenase (Re/Si-specific) subunit beta [Sulfobacillus thermosulfidooxidans]SMC06322.1 NAD(P) transhydrogenase subunit beta [Sulfobacillus thermosulfidooxidans DSM 9293]
MNILLQVGYLLTAILFILGVMRLRSPATARSGNLIAASGMVIAFIVTVIRYHSFSWGLIGLTLILGAIAGTYAAKKVRMTAMPQMVALFNGMGGGAASLVSIGELHSNWVHGISSPGASISALLTVLIGSLSFTGSLLAFAKLQEWVSGRPITFGGQKLFNGILLLIAVVLGIYMSVSGGRQDFTLLTIYVILAAVLGFLVVLPIGGADMPVVISLLNAFTGLAAAATGFLLANNVLIIAGALVGASGTILTQQMSRAMNRPIQNIIFGAFGKVASGAPGAVGESDGVVQTANVEDVATILAYARNVVIVPGYGLAVARAQQEVRQLMEKLSERGVNVRFGIHPVAGRMPGHMNVLLAEADVPYDSLYEMDAINPQFPQTDVVLVIGANDVTNPAARNQPGSPLYGMPILNVDQAQRVIVLKRGMNPGFAGIDNPLYTNPKTSMLFGDAKSSLSQIIRALDEV